MTNLGKAIAAYQQKHDVEGKMPDAEGLARIVACATLKCSKG